jgi:uncharacterized membrane protein
MINIDQLDNFEIPNNLSDADAEYIRIKLSRCKINEEAEKYRELLKHIEEHLHKSHKERIKVKNVKKNI